MQRRTLLASTSTLLVAGCTGMPGGDEPSADATPEPPQRNFSAKAQGETALVVYNDSEYLRTDTTEKVAVRVGNETETVWVADEAEADQSYPLSVGNQISVNASAGETVDIVWYPENSTEGVVIDSVTVEG